MNKDNESIISSTLGFEEILVDLRKCARVYYLIGVSKDKIHSTQIIPEPGHAMVMVIDTQSQTLEVCDCNGTTPNTQHVYY
jgi:hypothetical protein